MISFACKKIDLKDLITCSFEMNKTDFNLFTFLMKNDGFMTTHDIADGVGLDRTSVQKSIKRLVEKGIVERHQENLGSGGYTFVYRVKDKDMIKKQMLDRINTWSKMVKSEIDNW